MNLALDTPDAVKKQSCPVTQVIKLTTAISFYLQLSLNPFCCISSHI